MTIFLALFIAISLGLLLVLGKTLEIEISDFWGNRVKIPLETLVLGSVSIILFAHFGARYLAKPIIALDEWVKGDGKEVPQDLSDRQDELGDLSRSMRELRARLESEIQQVETDRDIHRSLNQLREIALAEEPSPATIRELLSIVIGTANADAAMLVRRDAEGGGFSVISWATAEGYKTGDVAGVILDDLVPERLLVRFRDAFETPMENLEGEAIPWTNAHFGGSSGTARTFVNLPVENEGQYIGSLLLVRSRNGLSLEQLEPLAGGVVSSAMYMETSIQRDENWKSIMTSLSKAVDAKSQWTNGHSERVADIANTIGKKLFMDEKELSDLHVSALLHDVGKIAIPESIIDKPGRLSDDEMAIMRQHPERGAKIVEEIPGYKQIRLAILHHHERWDGTGYPYGISGESIPFHARIIAIADVFDAITADRPYRKGLLLEQALAEIEGQASRAFDSELVRFFLSTVRKG
jgi:putative nucleotidyltransferase with HDIG domain